MYAIRPVLNRQLPVIIDKQTRAIAAAKRDGGDNIILYLAVALVLDPQLNSAYAGFQQALNPRHAIDNRIKPETKRYGRKVRLVHQAFSFFR